MSANLSGPQSVKAGVKETFEDWESVAMWHRNHSHHLAQFLCHVAFQVVRLPCGKTRLVRIT
jgi:hypothetical protein